MRCLNSEKSVCWNMGENVIGHCEPSDASILQQKRAGGGISGTEE
jgi:hypothetical protein